MVAAVPIKRSSLGMLFLLAAIGLGIAGYLTFLHYAFQRGLAIKAPACGPGGSLFDCHLIALSTHALFAGRPFAAWGAALYAVWVALAVVGWSGEHTHRLAAVRLISITALLAVLVDGYLGWLMLRTLHAVCLWCVATYVVNLGVLLIGWPALQRAGEPLGKAWDDLWLLCPVIPSATKGSPLVPVLVAWWCLTLLASVWGLTEVTLRFTQGDVKEFREQVKRYLLQRPASQVALEKAPLRGPATARLTIVEFSDFLCPACKNAVTTTKAALANHPTDVRLAFKHYPLEQECNPYVRTTVHVGACRVAAAASCAQVQGKFWALHDLIYARDPAYDSKYLEDDARKAGLDLSQWQACLNNGTGLQAVKQDIEEARSLQVTSTPTFLMNGHLFGGAIPPAAFETIIQEFVPSSTDHQ